MALDPAIPPSISMRRVSPPWPELLRAAMITEPRTGGNGPNPVAPTLITMLPDPGASGIAKSMRFCPRLRLPLWFSMAARSVHWSPAVFGSTSHIPSSPMLPAFGSLSSPRTLTVKVFVPPWLQALMVIMNVRRAISPIKKWFFSRDFIAFDFKGEQ